MAFGVGEVTGRLEEGIADGVKMPSYMVQDVQEYIDLSKGLGIH